MLSGGLRWEVRDEWFAVKTVPIMEPTRLLLYIFGDMKHEYGED